MRNFSYISIHAFNEAVEKLDRIRIGVLSDSAKHAARLVLVDQYTVVDAADRVSLSERTVRRAVAKITSVSEPDLTLVAYSGLVEVAKKGITISEYESIFSRNHEALDQE